MLAKMVAGGTMETPDVLYTNPSPSSNYAGGTIVTSTQLNGYKYVVVAFKYSTTDSTIRYIISKIYDDTTAPMYYASGQLLGIAGANTATAYKSSVTRGISINRGGIYVSNGTRTTDSADQPQACIPLKVWGFKSDFPAIFEDLPS